MGKINLSEDDLQVLSDCINNQTGQPENDLRHGCDQFGQG